MQTKGLQMGLFPNGQRHEEVAISMFFEMRGFRMSVASRERQRSDALAFSEAVSEKMLIQTEGLK